MLHHFRLTYMRRKSDNGTMEEEKRSTTMRCLHSNSDYFHFLDDMDSSISQHTDLAAAALSLEFPGLHFEEAKAVFCDWRAHSRTRVNCHQQNIDQKEMHHGG